MQSRRAPAPQPRAELVEHEPASVSFGKQNVYRHTHGMGANKTVRPPSRVFPQSIPRFTNNPCAARGIPAPTNDNQHDGIGREKWRCTHHGPEEIVRGKNRKRRLPGMLFCH